MAEVVRWVDNQEELEVRASPLPPRSKGYRQLPQLARALERAGRLPAQRPHAPTV